MDLSLLAHAGDAGHDAGEIALTALAIAAMVVPLLALGFIGRIFYRAYKRDMQRGS